MDAVTTPDATGKSRDNRDNAEVHATVLSRPSLAALRAIDVQLRERILATK